VRRYAVTPILAALATSGCAGPVDLARTKLRDRFAARHAPVVAERATPAPEAGIEPCSFAWVRDPPPLRREDLRLGPVVFRGLRGAYPPWRYAPARVVAPHLRRGEDPDLTRPDARDLAEQALANGPDEYAAAATLVDVPAGGVVDISLPAGHPNVSIFPAGVSRFGGFLPDDGVSRVRCRAEATADTSFHLGLIVAGAQCVPLTVTAGGRWTTKLVPFGVKRC
jgi:hypothetical protein